MLLTILVGLLVRSTSTSSRVFPNWASQPEERQIGQAAVDKVKPRHLHNHDFGFVASE